MDAGRGGGRARRSPDECDRAANSLLGRTAVEALPFVNAVLSAKAAVQVDDARAGVGVAAGW
jgi:hypothetical protein